MLSESSPSSLVQPKTSPLHIDIDMGKAVNEMKGHGRFEKLVLRPNDTPLALAVSFCKKFSLPLDVAQVLCKEIRAHLQRSPGPSLKGAALEAPNNPPAGLSTASEDVRNPGVECLRRRIELRRFVQDHPFCRQHLE